jgi:hypothetical protein
MVLTTTNKLLVTTFNINNITLNYLAQWNYSTNVKELEISLPFVCAGVFQYNNELYLVTQSGGNYYRIDLTSPYTLTFVQNLAFSTNDLSQIYGCITLEFDISSPTPTPTITSTITPTITQTVTNTPTVTLSQLPSISECSVILNSPASAYTYTVGSSLLIPINIPNILSSADISHFWDGLTGYVWMYNNTLDVIRQWTILSINPFILDPSYVDISYDVTITGLGNGLGCINSTTLVSSTATNPSNIIEIDISTNPFTYTTIFTLPTGFIIAGDLLVTTTGKIIYAARDFSSVPFQSYIYQYNYPLMTNEVETNVTSTIPNPLGLFQESGNIYVASSIGQIYQIDLNYPYSLTLVDSVTGSLAGASQSPQCVTSELTYY